jgi:hypothetical protein
VGPFRYREIGDPPDVCTGERQSAKKGIPPHTTPRRLKPCPSEARSNVISRSFATIMLDQAKDGPSNKQETPIVSSTEQDCTDGLEEQRKPNICTPIGASFTFSSPHNLLPALVPERGSPYAELFQSIHDRPGSGLWPHGVTATLAACLFNARALGIDIGRVLDPEYMSPFYRSSSPLVLPPGSAAVQSKGFGAELDQRFVALGPLRACFAQISFPPG